MRTCDRNTASWQDYPFEKVVLLLLETEFERTNNARKLVASGAVEKACLSNCTRFLAQRRGNLLEENGD